MNTKIIILIIVLVVMLGALLWFFSASPKISVQTPVVTPVEDTTAAIHKEINSVELDNTSQDFIGVDKDLQTL